ncbi:hypothetical protein QUW03_07835 [Faecalicoccus acidiformans]|uniref:hypothetical protein n=1 Tax=Faecalicoccus acidiformans TaxID=915173 RepID=UPI0025A385BA|nr:hypothetical protein [Faecalicoccus acidiformans]MDM8204278.1 hypothetical protein [Faecalicoccus acidiformans]
MYILDALKQLEHPISTDLETYYNLVQEWTDWWKGYRQDFHQYFLRSENKTITMERKGLRMGKKVCEDWANLLLNDKTLIQVNDEKTQAYLTGDDEEQQGGVLGRSRFWKMGNRLIEREFASGTACFYLDLVNPVETGGILSGKDVRIKYIKDARMIVPLSYENDDIQEVALASTLTRHDRKYLYLQLFLKAEGGQYRIENHFFDITNQAPKKIPNLDNIVDGYLLPCKPFVVVTPNIENNFMDVPLGMSIYANAIDQLKGCDMAFDNLYSDIQLGKKRIFMDQAAIAMNKDGTEPDVKGTLEHSLYVITGNRVPNQDMFMHEYNPDLRVTDNKENIQLNLNMLSSKVGFGQHRYQFDSQSMSTATEVRVSNKDLTESVWKQRITIQEALTELVHSILILAKEKCNIPVDPDAKISIQFDDTMFSDEETERMRFLQEISAGVRQKWEYRKKYLGEEEEEAREMTGETGGMETQGLQFPLDIQANEEDLDA